MRGILREFGSDLRHSVRLDQYYPNPRAVAAYHLARHAEFGDYIPPSTSVVMERCFSDDTTISSSLVAVVPGAEYEIRKIHPEGVASAPTSGFVPTVVCNDFVFVAGQMAHNPGQGLDSRAHIPEHSAWAGTETRKQTEFLIREKLKPALDAVGSSLERSLKAQIYLAHVADFPDFMDVWTEHFSAIPCAVTIVPTKSFATLGGIIEINLLALTNAATRDKQVIEADIPDMAACGPCIKSGEFLLPSGLLAMGHDGQLVGKALSPGFAGLAHAGSAQAAAGRSFVPGCWQRNEQYIARPVFCRRCNALSRHCHGLGSSVRRAAAPVHLHPDAGPASGARSRLYCRFLDFDTAVTLHPSSRLFYRRRVSR
jgi:enamine deaminase RidA (YjgF/YER057c/UK114 family)